VVNNTQDDAQLEQLLTQLLRMVSPVMGEVVPRGPATDKAGAAAGIPKEDYAESGAGSARRQTPKLPSISGSEARALIELVSARGIAQGELAALLGLDKSTVSRLAAGLERKGWIRRGRDEDNQRYVRLYLTAAGGERAGLSAGLRGLMRGLVAEGLLGEPAANAPG
jgi:hypothetical protein